ncbi:hypothetical protein P879_05131 [Paragonimus westermani]|uniref:Uncharacterized protein n=1 Tax=Paragonimus westermani TaxID=34504 RepID=A0A8T0DNI3_9TREM|nr:hypothetical protein P879_05131 [Paragonimus westermani]
MGLAVHWNPETNSGYPIPAYPDAKSTESMKLTRDQEYIDRIYLDAKETQGILDIWKQKSNVALINEWAIQQAFSFHHTGLIRYYNFSTPVYVNFITDHINGVEDPLYTETVLTTQYFKYKKVAVFHPPPNDLFRQYSSQHYNIPIPMTMVVSRDVEKVPMAVVGLQLTHHHLQNIFDRITNTCLSEPCETWNGIQVKRYLINQAALVLASTGGEKEAQRLQSLFIILKKNFCRLAQIYPSKPISVCKTYFQVRPIKSNWQGNVKSDEIQSNPLDDYETKDRYGSSRSEKTRNGYYDPYEYNSSPEALAIASLELHNAVRIVDEETGNDLQMPLLPPLVDEATEFKNPNFSNTNPIPNVTHEPELMEEPSDEIFGKMDQDPYEAQLRALAAIEACRQEQSALLQPHFEQDLESNFTESNNTHEADAVSSRMPIPGSLLDCVQKSVQQRCRLGSGTSSFTGRYACEAVCELIRERMPQLVNKLEDCKQPLIACTERFTVFHVLPRPPEDTSSSFGKNTDIASYTGEYCRECGTRRWWLRPIPETNLFLLVDYPVPGASSGPCGCNCQKRFRYGVQITNILFYN